jgi:hypothetical protein
MIMKHQQKNQVLITEARITRKEVTEESLVMPMLLTVSTETIWVLLTLSLELSLLHNLGSPGLYFADCLSPTWHDLPCQLFICPSQTSVGIIRNYM